MISLAGAVVLVRRWQLSPTLISTSIQPNNKLPFAHGFIITYWTLLQKESSNWLLPVKKMGSRQKADKAFLADCDDTMLEELMLEVEPK
jgi:hypothetical protein